MKISTKGRYALRIIIDLAQHGNINYISIKKISERQNISSKYLETIVGILNKAGYVISLRGKGGGYKLAKEPRCYTVGSIIKLAEGNITPVSCLDSTTNQCGRAGDCIALPMWNKLSSLVNDYIESITIQDLLDGNYQI